MKKLIYLFLIVGVFAACSEEDPVDDNPPVSDTPWERQFYYGNVMINGQDVLAYEVTTTNTYIEDQVCYSDLPFGEFTSYSLHIYVPKHLDEGYLSGFEESDMRVYYNQTDVTPKIYQSGSIQFVGQTEINNVIYSEFLLGGYYDGSDVITRDNFREFKFDFNIQYKEESTGELIYSEPRYVLLSKNNDC